LLRGQEIDELAQVTAQEVPSTLNVPQQAVRLVLREDVDAPDPGVQTIREREVDDSVAAPKVNGRLGALVGELLEARSAPTGQDERDRSSREVSLLRVVGHFRIRMLAPERKLVMVREVLDS
jgi:hypothetical protein